MVGIIAQPLPAAAAAHQANDQQQDHRADGGIENLAHQAAGGDVDAEFREQPRGEEGADDADDDVADQAEAGALDDLAGEPAGNQADDENDEGFRLTDTWKIPG